LDAVNALADAKGTAKLIAGGTDLLLDIQQSRLSPPDTLVDISEIPEMLALVVRENQLFIGAAVPHNQISQSSLVKEHAWALTEACGLIGGPQVRNVATLGGNVGHALPAADGTIALMALNAKVEIAGVGGRRLIPLVDLFRGPGKNTLARDELIVGFYLPLKDALQASAFRRVMRPQGVAIAILNCAVWLERAEDKINQIRISIGPSGPTPKRLFKAENHLKGSEPTRTVIDMAFQAVIEEANFRTSRYRATHDYRQHVAIVLLQECVETSWDRALAD
jgi:carbon-monoxide dehydrogenase medium subunit